mmetsp:Transcript_3649/g.10925  ORF Transcript_3649/g.10925 Transcript_3649/m.10925 type:complete len:215 (-) Transcript_3649:174-818(-)
MYTSLPSSLKRWPIYLWKALIDTSTGHSEKLHYKLAKLANLRRRPAYRTLASRSIVPPPLKSKACVVRFLALVVCKIEQQLEQHVGSCARILGVKKLGRVVADAALAPQKRHCYGHLLSNDHRVVASSAGQRNDGCDIVLQFLGHDCLAQCCHELRVHKHGSGLMCLGDRHLEATPLCHCVNFLHDLQDCLLTDGVNRAAHVDREEHLSWDDVA